ncbi:unnamed protein product [Vicia faba]|uniref:non-specific serine/threonine protein kinase n=1 Tax=Vicia faba TaxID=3906 RepID=A0AAV1B8S0_VICFA|nr:unnamed protein product [Vicia faba]
MSYGNLFEALHRNVKDENVAWDWNQRDIKSSNILLDEDYEAKTAEFGAAGFAEKSQMGYSFFAGTHGYIAPGCGNLLYASPEMCAFRLPSVIRAFRLLLNRNIGEKICHIFNALSKEKRSIGYVLQSWQDFIL